MKEYQYTQCGLDYIFLLNGFTIHETPYGNGVTINHADQLHEVIAECIIKSKQRIRGKELRFLRSVMNVSQKRIGEMLGLERSRIAQIESEPEETIKKTLDNLLRYRYAAYMKEDSLLRELCEYLDEIEERAQTKAILLEDEAGQWQCEQRMAA